MQSGYMAETGSELLGETETLRICCREPEREPGQGIETILWFDQATKTYCKGSSAAKEPLLFAVYFLPLL